MKKEKKKEKEKIPHMCESIGHRFLRGRCPKGKNGKKGENEKKKKKKKKKEKKKNKQRNWK